MKKLFLLMLAGAVGFSSQAQQALTKSLVAVRNDSKAMPLDINMKERFVQKANAANKGTAGGSRWYSYVSHLFNIDPAIGNNGSFPYMWNTANGQAIYSDGAGGYVLDTIFLSTFGTVLHPQYTQFNSASLYPGDIAITATDAYTLDSVAVYGVYGRNASKPGVVDTLIFAATYGNGAGTSNIPAYRFININGIDTLVFTSLVYDSVKNRATSAAYDNTNMIIKKIPLTPASQNDTLSNGLNAIRAAINLSIPAGNFVGASVTFKSGDTYVANDTIYSGSVTPTRPFKYGMFRPSIFELKDGEFATTSYTKNPRNYNDGLFNFQPFPASWSDLYIPMYAWNSAASTLEMPDIDYKITCNTCKTTDSLVSIKRIEQQIASSVSPNPAQDQIKIQFSLQSAANTTLSITNTIGQKVASQDLGKLPAKTVQSTVVNVSNLTNGIYFYTIEANGQRTTQRFVVAH